MKRELPTDEAERVVFCLAYGDEFARSSDHEKSLRYARFAIMYSRGMNSTELLGVDLTGDGSYRWPADAEKLGASR